MTNKHKGSDFQDFLTEEGIEVLCKICKKEKAIRISDGDIKILVCDSCIYKCTLHGTTLEHLFLIIFERLEKLEKDIERKQENNEEKNIPDILLSPIEKLEITTRLENCLKGAEIYSIGELVQKTEADLLKIINLGKISLKEAAKALAKNGLSLNMKINNPVKINSVPLEEFKKLYPNVNVTEQWVINWINVKDRLPEDNQQILTYGIKPQNIHDKSLPIITAIYNAKYNIFESDHFCESSEIINVTHWMSLPEPPKD